MKSSIDSVDHEDYDWENIDNSNNTINNNDYTSSKSILLLAYNINKMTKELNELKKEISAYRLSNIDQQRLSNLHFALCNASINEFSYYKSVDDIYLKKAKVLSSFVVREIIQVFIQGHGYKIDGYYLDDKSERTILENIPFYTTQRELMSLIKKGHRNKMIESAQNAFIENISNQIHILIGSYPKVDVINSREIVIWEN